MDLGWWTAISEILRNFGIILAGGLLADERLEVRLGAIFTLRQIAADFADLTGDVFDLLAAYVRNRDVVASEPDMPPDIKIIIEMVGEHLGERP